MNGQSRRRFLRSLGLGAGALLLGPLVKRLTTEASAQSSAPRRLVVFGAHGFTRQWWRPAEAPKERIDAEQLVLPADAYTLAPMLEPLNPHKSDLLLLDGLAHDMRGVGGEIQHGGHYAWLTCQPSRETPAGPSFDQYVAETLSADAAQPSLLFGMWGKASESEQRLDATTFATGKDRPAPHYVNALAMLEDVFGTTGVADMGPSGPDLRELRLRDVLREDLNRLHQRLPAPEKERLELYIAAVEEFDQRRARRAELNCDAPPTQVGSGAQAHFEAMFDLGILALKCGLTNVLGIATGTGGQPRHNNHMPVYESIGEVGSHDWNPDRLLEMHQFHTELMARLWSELLETPGASGSMADETVVLYAPTNGMVGDTSHHSNNYGTKNRAEYPVMLLSRVPGLRTGGDYIHYNDSARSRNFPELLHALSEVLSVDPSGFGKGGGESNTFNAPLEDIWT